jgi:flagellar hook-length control protein FliK
LIAAGTAIAVDQQPSPVNAATAASSDSNAPLAITAIAIASTSTQSGLNAQLAPTSTQGAGQNHTLAATDAAKATVEKTAGQATTESTPAQPQLVPTDLAATGAELIAATANATTTKFSTTGFKAAGATVQSKAPAGTSTTGTSDAVGGSATTTTAAQSPSVLQSRVAATADSPNASIDPLISNGGNGPPSLTPSAAATHDRSSISPDTQAAAIPTDAIAQASAAVPPALTVAPQIFPTGALTASPATGAPVPLGGLAVEIAASAQSGKTRFELRLEPAELGRIDVRIDVDRNGQVTSHLTVEKAETLAILRQDAPQLQQALNDAGLKTSSGGLQFSLRDQSSYGSGQNGNNNPTSGNAQQLVISEEETMQAALAGQLYGRLSGASSGVDIRV